MLLCVLCASPVSRPLIAVKDLCTWSSQVVSGDGPVWSAADIRQDLRHAVLVHPGRAVSRPVPGLAWPAQLVR